MNRDSMVESNSKTIKIISASAQLDADMIYLQFESKYDEKVVLELDEVATNGLRIAIGSLQNIPRLVLPKNPLGEYQSHFLSIEYEKGEELIFYKENENTMPFGKYYDIEDGLIAFNKEEVLQVGFSTEDAKICLLEPNIKFLVLQFPEKITLDEFKRQLDKEIFPFNRFGKTNKLAYGYFHTIKED